jgi:hypothetical protein
LLAVAVFGKWRRESGGVVPGLKMAFRCMGDGAVLMVFGTEVTGRMPVPLCLLRLEVGIPAGCG